MKVKVQVGDGGVRCNFSELPEGCIAAIVSFTSPRDACRLSLVSSVFKSACDSDAVWSAFLPSDYKSIVASAPYCGRSSPSPHRSSSLKDQYFSLCDDPLLVGDGKMSFSLDRRSGKKFIMLSARTLSIVWGDTPIHWSWTPSSDSRFAEVAELISVDWLEIRGKISSGLLSPGTNHAAYLVFKTTPSAFGFEGQSVEVGAGFVDDEGGNYGRCVYLSRGNENDIVDFFPFLGLDEDDVIGVQPHDEEDRDGDREGNDGDGDRQVDDGDREVDDRDGDREFDDRNGEVDDGDGDGDGDGEGDDGDFLIERQDYGLLDYSDAVELVQLPPQFDEEDRDGDREGGDDGDFPIDRQDYGLLDYPDAAELVQWPPPFEGEDRDGGREGGDGDVPTERRDGWLEVELGEFFVKEGENREVEMRVLETKGSRWKCGLIVQGIEIRPKEKTEDK